MGCGGSGFTTRKNNNCATYQYICPDESGCPPGIVPDFEIKRHDTLPAFVLSVSDCDGPLDLTDCVAEVSMWANARFKAAVAAVDASFSLADNIGFYQTMVGDIVVVDHPRSPEQMLVTGFDETNKTITVQRAYGGTTAVAHRKGGKLRIFRILNSVAEVSEVTESIQSVYDGSFHDEITESKLIYNWNPEDTCLAGCYWFEFKLLKMDTELLLQIEEGISTISVASISGCELGTAVLSARRFPMCDAFLVRICDSPTAETLG